MIRRLAGKLARALLQFGGNLLVWSLHEELERQRQRFEQMARDQRAQHLANCTTCRSLVARSVFGTREVPRA